jgi:GAF domain-containing protein
MIKTQKPLMLNTAQEQEDFVQAQNIARVGPSAKAWLGVPLIAAGQVVGVMVVQSYSQENIYTPRDLALFSMIGNQAAIAIQNARLFEQTQARARREQTLREITARVRSSTDPDAVMRALVQELGAVLGRSTFVRLGSAEELSEPKAPRGQAPVTPFTRGNGDQPSANG